MIPLIIGIVWGNLDETSRELAEKSLPIITFFMMIPIGAGMSLASLAEGGFAGILLAILSAMSAFVLYFLFQLCLPKNLSLIHIFTEGRPAIVRNRMPVAYNPEASAPVIWLNFLDGLLHAEDIPTLQEFIGYCLIPSNKGQRMMVIKGNGGEGKSQIGAVLSTIFGTNMKDGSIGKISENRFARADLEHILLCVDETQKGIQTQEELYAEWMEFSQQVNHLIGGIQYDEK